MFQFPNPGDMDYLEDLRSAVTDPSPPSSLPHIDPYHSSNITALAGTNTRLNCRVYRYPFYHNRLINYLESN